MNHVAPRAALVSDESCAREVVVVVLSDSTRTKLERPAHENLRHRRAIDAMRRECLDRVLCWNARDLERKLADFEAYYSAARSHASLEGHTPLTFGAGPTVACAELNNALGLPVPGPGPTPTGGLMTNSRRTGLTTM